METPIADFVRRYADSGMVRAHVPGHKGKPFLGCEALDITEIRGADSLYEADGIIRRSESCAGELFGSGRTVYSTEGSSQCIRAMLYLALICGNGSRTIVAARNVHRAFLYAAALLDFEIVWLWPEQSTSLCSCPVSPDALERTLTELPAPPAAVYLTSPDYLGGMADISALAEVCRKHSTLLAVDNAHGAYLRFLEPSRHPLDLGAALCCDSAHKTLPVLTGGAYLHISRAAPASLRENAKTAMAMFGSTSPSYLTLASLDLCNRYLADGYRERLREMCVYLDEARKALTAAGWQIEPSDPLRLTIKVPSGMTGGQLADRLRENGVECEYADLDFLVLRHINGIVCSESMEDPFNIRGTILRPVGSGYVPCGRHCLPRGRPYRRRSRWDGSAVRLPLDVRLRSPLRCPVSELAGRLWHYSAGMAWSRWRSCAENVF